MMLKKKSNPWARAKYLYVLPLAAVAVAAFARPEISNELKEISAVKVNDLAAIVKAEEVKSVETVAVSDEKKVKVKGKLLDDALEPVSNASILLKGTKDGTLTDVDGSFAIEAPVGSTLVISALGLPTRELEVLERYGVENMRVTLMLAEADAKVKVSEARKVEYKSEAGKETTDQDEKNPIFMVVEQMPEFPGGMAACMKFLGENIRYPEVAHKNGVQGRVILQFVVETDGSVSSVKVVRSVSPEIDAEAVRVVGLMPKWKPGMQRGKAVRVRYTLPVTFSLDKPKDSTDDEVAIAVNPSSEGGAEQQVFQVVEQMPEFPGGMGECLKFLASNVRYPEVAQTNKIQGRVIVQFIVEKDGSIASPVVVRGVDPYLDAEAIRVISIMPKWKPGMQKGQAVSVRYTIPVTFRLQGDEPKEGDAEGYSMTVKADKEAMGLITVRGGNFHSTQPVLIMIDGVKSDSTAMAKLTPRQIDAISVLKDKDAIAKYGDEGKNGVIVITTKKE